ncbi:MAG: hypothetical protein ABIS36_17510 [Chryseolinea sp.]
MKAATVNEIRKELTQRDAKELQQLCAHLARYKKENKELLTYLLFEAHDEEGYIAGVKADIDEQFEGLQMSNVYFTKKGLRRILRILNKQIRYSGQEKTEVELRIAFCDHIIARKIPLRTSQLLTNLYSQQIKKIGIAVAKLPEDLQFDYEDSVQKLKSVL